MEKPRPNLCTQDGRDHREGLDAKKNKTLLEEEKCFHLTSPFIELKMAEIIERGWMPRRTKPSSKRRSVFT